MADREKMYDLENPQHVEEILRMLDEDDEDIIEDFGDETDTDGEDQLEVREADSETEQEDDSEAEEEFESNENDQFFLGKDKITKWYHNPKSNRVRTPAQNLIKRLPGVIGNARNASTPLECWNCFFTNDIMEPIVAYTNQYITSIAGKFDRERDAKPIDLIELKAFIGLLFLAGVYKSNRQSLEDLWGTDGDGVEKFGLVMSIKRFKFIIRCIRFDDRLTREDRKINDRLAAVRDIFTKFVRNCQKSYCLGENVTIDEKLESFRGRCLFRQYIPSKPAKYGIKIFALVDAKLCYLYNMEIYAGKQPDGPFNFSNKPADIVKRMVHPIEGSGRNLTADNWFTDFDLVEELRRKKISFVGTVRKNKRQLPPEFVTSVGRQEYSSEFGFNNSTTLVSYVPRKGKTVILVSTLHNDKSIDMESGGKAKPSIITFYNQTKGGVDTADKMCASFNVARNIKRWPMVVFFAMLNMSSINSQIIYIGNGCKEMRRRLFIKQLSHELVLEELTRRSQKNSGIPFALQERLKKFRPHMQEERQLEAEEEPVRKKRRCLPCTSETGTRRLSRYECKKCKKALCLQHANFVCTICLDTIDEVC